MSKVKDFYDKGVIDFTCKIKPVLGKPILYVENKDWYKFQVDELYEIDSVYIVSSRTLLDVNGIKR